MLHQWSSVELLLRRAPSSFIVTEANRGDVVDLCRRLDGLPLALELAASQLGSMTPAEIITALGARVQMSRANASDDSRHRTIDATIGWSYELLFERPRRLFHRLGVMSGRFSFDDVLSVCATEPFSAETTRDWLSSLVDQSLVMAETIGTTDPVPAPRDDPKLRPCPSGRRRT